MQWRQRADGVGTTIRSLSVATVARSPRSYLYTVQIPPWMHSLASYLTKYLPRPKHQSVWDKIDEGTCPSRKTLLQFSNPNPNAYIECLRWERDSFNLTWKAYQEVEPNVNMTRDDESN